MSEIKKYQMALRHLTNPRYMTRDFVVPLYTGAEPDPETEVQPDMVVPPQDVLPKGAEPVMPSAPGIPNPQDRILELAGGGSVERQGFSAGTDFKEWLLNEYRNKNKINKTLSELIKDSGIDVKYATAHFQIANNEKLRKKFNVGEWKVKPLPEEMKNIFKLTYPNKKWEELSYGQRGNFINDFSRKQKILESIPKNYITIDELAKKLNVPIKTLYETRTNLGKFIYEKLKPMTFGSIKGGFTESGTKVGGTVKYFKDPGQRLLNKILEMKETNFQVDTLNNKTIKNINNLYDNYLDFYKQGKLPKFEDIKNMTPGEVGTATTRLAQILDGKKFRNEGLENIRINKNVASKMFEQLNKHPWGDPYRSNLYKISLDTIDQKLGNKKGTFNSLKKEAVKILKENNIPVYNLKDKDPKGFNINEIAGTTGSSRSKAAEFSQFIDIMEGNLNQKQLASFQSVLSRARSNIESNPDAFNKEAKKLNSLASSLEEQYGVKLPRIRPATEVGKYYNQERLAELNKLGLNIEAASKRAGYTIQMPEGASTIQEFINNPEIQNKTIADFFKQNPEAIKIARTAGFRCRKSVAGPVDVDCLAEDVIKQAEKGTTSAINKISKLSTFAKGTGNFIFDALIGKTPAALAVNFGLNIPSVISEASEGKPKSQILGSLTDVIGLGPLVGTTEKDELTKIMGADADTYLKIEDTREKYNNLLEKINRLKSGDPSFVSPEDTAFDTEAYIQTLNKEKEGLYNQLKPYINKQGELVYPENIQKGLERQARQEELRKEINKLKDQGRSLDETTYSFDTPQISRLEKNLLESEKQNVLYGKEIDRNTTLEDMQGIEEMGARGGAAEGGRIGFEKGGMSRRGFLGLLAAGAAATPDLIRAVKGTGKASKAVSKIKFEKVEGMYSWFPDLVEKIKVQGKPFEETERIMEASYKHEAKGYGGLPKGVEKITKHVDGDTTFLLREYPDGRIAVDIHSPRNQEGSSTPVTLYYRPTMELKYYYGTKVEPAEFKVLEKEPRYFANGPDDVDIEMSEMRKIPGKNTIFGDVEAAERFATGDIKNRKIIPAKQARREQMEDAPVDFIEETSPYGPVYD